MARRIFDPRQQGARLSWGNDLFQMVERVQPQDHQPANLPQPTTSDATFDDWLELIRQAESIDVLKSRP